MSGEGMKTQSMFPETRVPYKMELSVISLLRKGFRSSNFFHNKNSVSGTRSMYKVMVFEIQLIQELY